MTLFSIFGISITAYGFSVAIAALLSVLLSLYTSRKQDLKAGTSELFALLAIPVGFLGARLAYMLLNESVLWNYGFGYFWNFRSGGYVLYGTLGGCLLSALLCALLTHQKPSRIMDALSAPALLMIALCRFAEGFAEQGYGWEIENEALCFFPLGIYDPSYEVWYWALFMLEGLYALILCVRLLRAPRYPFLDGDRTMLFLYLYACGQIVFESIRQDDVMRWGFVRCSQVISAIVAFFVLLCFQRRHRGSAAQKIISAAALVLCFGIVMLMEFAIEQKIPFLLFLDVPACYAVMATAMLAAAVLGVWERGRGRGVPFVPRKKD